MADLNPPPWRGAACSTFQHWKFSTEPNYETLADGTVDAGPFNPEVDQNPYILPAGNPVMKRPWLIVRGVDPPKTEWLQGYATKTGVWRLEPKFRVFGRVPDAGKSKDPKKIRIQLTYYKVTVDPDITIDWPENPDSDDLKAANVQTQPADHGWTHRTWDFELFCTTEERIELTCEGVVYIDQLVIDTICECDRGRTHDRKPTRRPRPKPKPKLKRPRSRRRK